LSYVELDHINVSPREFCPNPRSSLAYRTGVSRLDYCSLDTNGGLIVQALVLSIEFLIEGDWRLVL
jgi:hypothetical protein